MSNLNVSLAEALQYRRYRAATNLLKEALFAASEYRRIDIELINQANSVAKMFYAQSEYQQAAALYRSVLLAQQNVLGADHPDVADSLANLRDVLWETGCTTPS
ncbi:MAG: tetratricopeptide repeat protein [Candidatus Obscuribacterales bacterium]|nr:tetratricopeptide repeat protein [Candidatus Obscuribacterales bacterium]